MVFAWIYGHTAPLRREVLAGKVQPATLSQKILPLSLFYEKFPCPVLAQYHYFVIGLADSNHNCNNLWPGRGSSASGRSPVAQTKTVPEAEQNLRKAQENAKAVVPDETPPPCRSATRT
jgi:hypothetical protein